MARLRFACAVGSPSDIVLLACRSCLSLALSCALVLAGADMLGLGDASPALAAACAVVLAEALLAIRPALARGVNIAGAIAFVTACALRPAPLRDGLPLLANRAFEASAARQRYVYEMFQVAIPADEAAAALTFAFAFIAAAACAALAFFLLRGHVPPVLGLVASFFALQAYLGLAPAPVFDALLAVAALAAGAACGPRPGSHMPAGRFGAVAVVGPPLAVIAICILLAAIIAFAYPADWHAAHPLVAQLNEDLRDAAAGGESVVRAANGLQAREDGGQRASAAVAEGSEQGVSPELSDSAQSAPVTLSGWPDPWLLVVLLAVALASCAAGWYLVLRGRTRRAFASSDPNAAVHAMFANLVRRIQLAGAPLPTRGYSRPPVGLERFWGHESHARYEEFVRIWQCGRYGTAPLDAARRSRAEQLFVMLSDSVLKHCGPLARMRVSLLCHIRQIP